METTVFWDVSGMNLATFKGNRLQGPKRLYVTTTLQNITMHKASQNMNTQQHSATWTSLTVHSDAVCTKVTSETSQLINVARILQSEVHHEEDLGGYS
jgi:hypothetical protein